jgi:hypothetical protein
VFFVDAVAVIVIVVFFAVARRVVPTIITGIPRVEGFSEFLQNPLTGLRMESSILFVILQLAFQVRVIGDLPGFVPLLAGVVVGNVPELAGTPPVVVERLCNL